MSVQQFCLRWNNHQPNFISVCSSLLHNGTLVDVTLAAEGRQLQAHKIVLSACSSYFQTLFTTNPCQHPIVILKDVQYDDLKTMVDFMYYGEVNVSQEQLPHILKTAEMLKIKGLAEMPTDPANLTKSDSKSSNEPNELMGNASSNNQASAAGNGGGSGSSGGIGSSNSGSVADSLWGSTESQFQQQHHHHQHQQQIQQQQQQQHHHHQQQQAQQQQQQQHHHQQQNSQTQTAQQHGGLLRRTPSPLSAGASPATRRKRLRKSSNNGSGDRTSSEDQHTGSLDTSGNATGVSLSQMCQMSFGTSTGPLGNLTGHTLHTTKLLKESVNPDLEPHPQDSDSLDDGHGRVPMQIKPEVDISGVQQSIPLDISGATTPSEHDAPNSQSAHSDIKASSSTSRSARASTPLSAVLGTSGANTPPLPSQVPMGSKRNRILTRQPRVKRDSDSLSTNIVSSSPEPTIPTGPSCTNSGGVGTTSTTSRLEFEPLSSLASSSSSTSYSSVVTATAGGTLQQQQQHQQHHHHHHHHSHLHPHHHHFLSVPQRIERHSSEPAPSLTPSSPHLLTVPQSTPFLMKQFSDPLLPSQQAALSGSATGATNPFAPLHRQYSHPLPGSHITSAPLQHSHHISLPESIYASGSPPPAGSSQYLVPQQQQQQPTTATTILTHNKPSSSNVSTESNASSALPTTQASTSSLVASSMRSNLATKPLARLPQLTATYVSDTSVDCHSNSPPPPPLDRHSGAAVATGGPKLTSSKSANATMLSERITLHPQSAECTSGQSSSFEHFPTLRVKTEELQRSVSSPQTTREIIFLENPRSSHCPVIRPGPALGCNFCWNTIDGHGRILRRKTKYHCPECQTNLCIVPCFQEYHERLNNESASSSNTATGENASSKNSSSSTTTSSTTTRHYTKTESI